MPDMVDPAAVMRAVERDPNAPVRRPDKRPHGNRPGAKLLDKVTAAQRRLTFASMFARGDLMKDIAAHHKVSVTLVSQEIDKVVREIEARALETLSKRQARAEYAYEMVLVEAILGFYASKKGKKTRTVKSVRSGFKRKNANKKALNDALEAAFGSDDVDDGIVTETSDEDTTRIEESVGDPRWLSLVLDAQDRIVALRRLIPKGEAGGEGLLGGQADVRRLGTDERIKLLQALREKAQLKRAQQLALKSADEEARPAITVTPTHREPVPAPVVRPVVEESEDTWLL